MWKSMKKLFQPLSVRELAVRELAESERAWLEAQTAASYANALVQHNINTINRLRAFLKDQV